MHAMRAMVRLAAILWVAVLAIVAASGVRAAELVMVEHPGCPWCVRWHAEIGPAYPNTPEGRRAPLRRLQISDAPRSGIRFASPLNVSPTFVLVERNVEVGRIIGYPGADFFWGLLDELLRKLPSDRPATERLRETRAPALGNFATN